MSSGSRPDSTQDAFEQEQMQLLREMTTSDLTELRAELQKHDAARLARRAALISRRPAVGRRKAPTPPRPRTRGAGRPRAQRTGSSSRTSSSDPGDSDPAGPPPLAAGAGREGAIR